jgi:hypothetical protein
MKRHDGLIARLAERNTVLTFDHAGRRHADHV